MYDSRPCNHHHHYHHHHHHPHAIPKNTRNYFPIRVTCTPRTTHARTTTYLRVSEESIDSRNNRRCRARTRHTWHAWPPRTSGMYSASAHPRPLALPYPSLPACLPAYPTRPHPSPHSALPNRQTDLQASAKHDTACMKNPRTHEVDIAFSPQISSRPARLPAADDSFRR